MHIQPPSRKKPRSHLCNMPRISPKRLLIPLSILNLLLFLLPFHGNSQTFDQEQTILLKLKNHWSNPASFSHWTLSSNSDSSHCDWPEITCTNGSVTGLSLAEKEITGVIPPFICDLKNLTIVDLQNNSIYGLFPKVLYNCSKLEHLNLSQNYFTGVIPYDIDRLSTHLQSLDLGSNNFTGDIPATIGRFPELISLILQANEFKDGSFPPEIGNLSSLEVLQLSFNNFSKRAIPTSFTQLKKLKQLMMTESNLGGEIPASIGNIAALELLDLSINSMSGSIPSGLFSLEHLTTLFLYRNQFYGPIPQTVETLKLEVIDVSENNLTGPVPDDFGRLTKLSGLALFFNHFSGELPESIGRLPSLMDFKLFGNNFSGVLPPDLGLYSKLRDFEVPNNKFTGKLPEHLCANGTLISVVAFDNNLSGELPNSLGNCGSLLTIQVHRNRLSGNIPSGLWTSPNLLTLMLSNNLFTGQLPNGLGSHLSRLEINNNNFSGEIPAGVSSWKSLTVFQASNNLFSGSIPQEVTALPLLTTLLLDGNQFSGHLPSEVISWNWLTKLDLSRNKLFGPIPAKIGSLPRLIELDLSGNEFSGQIPLEIGHLKLTSLNLSSNLLIGGIPEEFENPAFTASFLNNSALCSSNPSLGLHTCSSPSQNSNKSTQLLTKIIIIPVVLFALGLLLFFIKVRTHRYPEPGMDPKWKFIPYQVLKFSESDILPNLTENNVVGYGGSGKVYRVVVNRSNEVVAVKMARNIQKHKQFQAEVKTLGTIRHPNIVRLLCCVSNETTKLLVYEYLEKQSLDKWLYGKKNQPRFSGSVHESVVLDWPKRLQIAVGAARGLCYMHHDISHPIIHRDVKSSNILLNSEFNAKIADFGLARWLRKHEESNSMSNLVGSFGYMAPEYAKARRVNEKIDVYSFGVVLLELVTGRKAHSGDEELCLADWAWRHFQENNPIVDALDEEIKEENYLEEMTCVFKLGIICTSTFPSARPSMKDVLQILLRCSHQLLGFKGVNGESEYVCILPLKNSRRERMLNDDDDNIKHGSLVSNVYQ